MIDQSHPSFNNADAKTSFAPVPPRDEQVSPGLTPPNYYPSSSMTVHQPAYFGQTARGRAISRFWKAVIIAVSVCFVFELLVTASVKLSVNGKGNRAWVSGALFEIF